MPAALPRGVARALLFFLASNAAVLFVLRFGLFLWPERLPANSQNIFWLASGVNVAGLLLLGLRYWPVLLLNAFPAWLLLGEPPGLCFIGAITNAMEALLAAWMILRLGAFEGRFDRLSALAVLVVASCVAPLINTVVIPAYLCAAGAYPWTEYGRALGNWNLSNGAALLILTPLIVAVTLRDWSSGARGVERVSVAGIAAGLGFVAFDAVFRGTGMNFAFIVFPVVIYTAVRFGIGETAAVLGLTLLAIYSALLLHAQSQPPAQMSEAIWFVQAFCWVLAATGLLVASLGAERRRAERVSLEASLAAERARLAALRYQLNPHFLFNALNSVRAALPLSESIPREMVTDLSRYLRSTLSHENLDSVPLRDELAAVRDYLAIEQHRFGDDLQTTFDIQAEEIPVPIFLLQPLVENAIRHGFESSQANFHLRITARIVDSRLVIEVANSGAWKSPESGTGLGLKNTRRRLELIHGDAATFEPVAEDGWVRIKIGIPLPDKT